VHAFTMKAIELFTSRIQEIHQLPKPTGYSFFERFKEFAPLIWVASTVYELVSDSDIVSLEVLYSYLAQFRRQFSATDELEREAQEQCGQMLELCLSYSFTAGKNALTKHFGVM
jgi:hypothetical protein